jgi:hypothetical protein
MQEGQPCHRANEVIKLLQDVNLTELPCPGNSRHEPHTEFVVCCCRGGNNARARLRRFKCGTGIMILKKTAKHLLMACQTVKKSVKNKQIHTKVLRLTEVSFYCVTISTEIKKKISRIKV